MVSSTKSVGVRCNGKCRWGPCRRRPDNDQTRYRCCRIEPCHSWLVPITADCIGAGVGVGVGVGVRVGVRVGVCVRVRVGVRVCVCVCVRVRVRVVSVSVSVSALPGIVGFDLSVHAITKPAIVQSTDFIEHP